MVETIKQDRPVTVTQQKAFLESILTEAQINSIFSVYDEGQDIIGMIENNEFDYNKVKGLGEKTYEKMKNKVMENLEMSEVLVFLSKYGIKYNMIAKLVKEYKSPQIVIQKIEENPYVLTEIKGIGFTKADEIAKAVGYSMTSPHRITSCIHHVIGEENSSGHSWINQKQLLNRCIEYLKIDKQYIKEVLAGNPKGVMKVGDKVTREKIFEAESLIAQKLIQLKTRSKQLFTTEELDQFLDEYCEENNVELEENQRKFFYDWNNNSIAFLVGGGGMGKLFV